MIELLPFLPVIFGGTSATIAVANFTLAHSRKLNAWQSLRDGLQKFSQSPKRHKTGDEELIINWLSYGDLIVTPLRARLLERLWITLAVIVGLTLFSSYSTKALTDNSAILVEVSVGVAQLFLGLINGTGLLLRREEQDFLARLRALHHHFYESYVIPAMREFNYQADDSPLFGSILKAHAEEQKRIRSDIRNHLATRLGVPVENLDDFLKYESAQRDSGEGLRK